MASLSYLMTDIYWVMKLNWTLENDAAISSIFSEYNRGSVLQKNELYSPPPQEVEASESRPTIVLQPLHIAIGVCLIILMLVAVLLHVVVVLYRRHHRLKRELIKQTQKIAASESLQHCPSTTMNQPGGQQIGLQQLKYSTTLTEQHQHQATEKSGRLEHVTT